MRLTKEFKYVVSYDIEFVGDLVFVHRLPREGDKDGSRRKKDDLLFTCCAHKEEDQFILSKAFWDKRVKSYGKNWLLRDSYLSLPRKETLRVASKEFMEHYLSGSNMEFGSSYYEENPLAAVKEEGTTRVVGIDDYGWAHLLYGVDGKVIPRPIAFNYISGRLNEANWDVDAIEKWMTMTKLTHLVIKGKETQFEGRPEKFRDVEIEEIPHYNSDHTTGSRAVRFAYAADPDEFQSFLKISEKKPSIDDYAVLAKIEEMIPKEFKKPEPVEPDDYDDW